MNPQEIHDELARKTDFTPAQLRDLKEMEDFKEYGDAKSGGEDLNEPVNDMIRLLETPASEYEDSDDGFNEVEEAQQALSFIDRMEEVEPGENVDGTNASKQEWSMYAWGVDPDKDDGYFD